MTQQTTQQSYRYERKYLVPTHCARNLETLVSLHPKFFSTVFQERVINNIYFDNHRLQNYFQNLNGIGYRLKHRLRWYSQDYKSLINGQKIDLQDVTTPHFEIKKRTGDLISKYLYPSQAVFSKLKCNLPKSTHQLFSLEKNDFTKHFSYESKELQKTVLAKIKFYQPVIVNCYRRKYFLSANKKIRVTIDSDVRFYQIINKRINWRRYYQLPATILEIKADQQYDQEIVETAKYFPLPLTKSSKYVLGVMSCLSDIESPLYKLPIQTRLVKTAIYDN